MTSEVARAYGATGAVWQSGPGVIYDRLAVVAVDACRVPVSGALVLDLGAGTGAVTRAALARGAAVVALDAAWGMLQVAGTGVPSVVGDALALPFADGVFDAVVAGFSLNHVTDPVGALIEVRRVLRAGGCVVATAYAEDDSHPVKEAVESALATAGWRPEPWYQSLRAEAVPLLATVDRAEAAAREAGFVEPSASSVRVPFPDLSPEQLVAWRIGMAQTAPFVAGLSASARGAVTDDALSRLGPDPPSLVRSVIVLVGSL